MTISKKTLIYRIYFTIICLTYITSANIVPPSIKWISNKLWICLLGILFLLILLQTNFKIKVKTIYPFTLLFLFSISLIYIYTLHLSTPDTIITWLTSGFLYFLLFITLAIACEFISIQSLLKPFLLCSIVIILLSTMVFFGFEPTYYLEDTASLNKYLDIKSSSTLVGFSGIYFNQNSFGIYLYIAVSVIFSNILLSRYNTSNIYSRFLQLFFLVALLFLFLTVSRASILAGLIIILLFYFRNYKNKLSLYLTIATVIACIIAYVYFNQYIEFLIKRIENDGTSSRTEIWANALEVFKQNPWHGVGKYEYGSNKLSAHNVYIQKLASQGIVVFTFWFLWLLYGLYWAFKKYIYNTTITSTVIAASFFAILVHQSFENTISDTYSPLTAFLIVTYSILINRKSIYS